MKWMCFPGNRKIPSNLEELTGIFYKYKDLISSETHQLSSDDVLKIIRPGLEQINYEVEKDKENKVKVPVIYGESGKSVG